MRARSGSGTRSRAGSSRRACGRGRGRRRSRSSAPARVRGRRGRRARRRRPARGRASPRRDTRAPSWRRTRSPASGRPASRASSSTPGCGEVGIGWRVRRARRQEGPRDLLHRFEVAALVRAPDLDHDRRARLGDAAGLAQRGDHVVGEEERVEAGDEVERVVAPRAASSISPTRRSASGSALAGERDQRLGGVDAVRLARRARRRGAGRRRRRSRCRARAGPARARCARSAAS